MGERDSSLREGNVLTSHSEFGPATRGSEVADVFKEHIRHKNVLITGVSPRSLGETLAVTVSRHAPANLILASRTLSKLEQVVETVISSSSTKPHLILLDLASQRSTRSAAAKIQQCVDHIDILINNAAVVSSERRQTEDGIEQTFAVSHIGHFLLTSQLTPLLLAAPNGARLVNVSSLGYRCSPIRFHDYNFEGKPIPAEEEPPASMPSYMKPDPSQGRLYQGFAAYGQSKTANILHCVSLNEKYGGRGLRAFAVHPGTIMTDLSRNLSPEDREIIEGGSQPWINHDQGTATILVAAFDPVLSDVRDQAFLSDCQIMDVADTAKSPAIAQRLWELSEQLTGEQAKL